MKGPRLMRTCLALVIAATLTSGPAFAQSVAVQVGVDGMDYDACSSYGTTQGLNPSGDNFLAVRSGPGTKYRMSDKLGPGDEFWICSERGGWVGIVYGRNDCGVGSPARSGPYRGPCSSGWVHGRYVSVIAS